MPRKSRKSASKKEQWRLHLASHKHVVKEASNNVNMPVEGNDIDVREISLNASFSQSDYRFSEYSRGTQCVANSLMFLAHLYETENINTTTLDSVLIKGDQLYSSIRSRLEKQNKFVSVHLNFNELPDTIETDTNCYIVNKNSTLSGLLLRDAPHGWVDFANLSLRIQDLGTTYSQALLLLGAFCISVFKDRNGRYGYFDPHPRTVNGASFEENGKAVMVTFTNVSDLADRLIQLYHSSLNLAADLQYDLLPVSFETVHIPNVQTISSETHQDKGSQRTSILSKVLTKLGKQRTQKVAKRLKRQWSKSSQQSPNETQNIKKLKRAEMKNDINNKRYVNDPVFKMSKKQQIRDRYQNDATFKQRQKQYIKFRYQNEASFQHKQKLYINYRYQNEATFQLKHKQYMNHRYQNDASFNQKQRRIIRDRYHNDLSFQLKQKQYVTSHYRNDPSFRLKQKMYIYRRYNFDTSFAEKHKSCMKANFKKHYTKCARLQRVQHDLIALHKIRCSNQIKNKYRSIVCLPPSNVNSDNQQSRDNPLIKEAQSVFKLNVKQGPTYICTVCHRCLFSNQVRLCKSSNYSKDPELVSMCLTGSYVHACNESCASECKMPERTKEWICHSCHDNLKLGHLPCIAVANNLELDPIPIELQGLNVLERHIIAKFIPFAKIISLPKGQQRAIHGAVVCVPAEVDSTVQCLPRPSSESQLLRVKLKRRLQYKGHFQFHNVDMTKVRTALLKLKEIHSEYTGVSLREDSEDDYLEAIEDAPVENDAEGDVGPEGDSENPPDEQEVSVARNYGINFDSCLQPADVGQEILSFGDNVYSIAPAEGNQPVNFFKTPKLESMAFPVQFNTGRNTFDQSNRPTKISPSRYFNARLFNVDNRFAMDANYVFFAQFVTEMHLAMSSMSIQLRKGKVFTKDGRKITNRLLQDQQEVQKLVKHGEATRFMQPLRGTPAFWEKTMKDLFACLRQLGLPTFFCTFSAAEMRWPEFIEAIKRQQGETVNFSELDWATKCDILRSNPVTVIRLFEKRVEALMRDLILSPSQPIGEVVDWFYRVEFQARGSGHIHCLFWIKDAPKFDEDDDEVVAAFIDKHISCQLPDEKTDPELHGIVKDVQSHSRNHTKSCKKGNKHCRFGFPKPPVKSTFISRPEMAENDEPSPIQHSKAKLKPVWDLLHDPAASFESIDQVLSKCNLTYESFSHHLDIITTKTTVMMKRDPKDCWVNCYNGHLLRAWNANMDIQYVLDPYSCIMYMLAYITKAEHEMSDFLKRIVTESSHENPSDREQMKQVMQAYAKNREVSVQEAVTRVCSLKLKSCSRNVIFIPTDDNALKMSLPLKSLEMRDPDSHQVWMTGLLEKYKARPQTPEFEAMCMADFASNYRLVYGKQRQSKNSIPLQFKMGFIQKRTRGKPAVIRYARFSQTKDPEKYFGTLLKIFLPYRCQSQLKVAPFYSYQSFYIGASITLPGSDTLQNVFHIVSENQKRYETNNDAIDHAIKDFVQCGPMEDAWASLAPNTELVRIETMSERVPLDQDEINEQDDVPEFQRISELKTAMPLVECPALSPTVVRQMYQSLNQTQAAVFYMIREWSLKLVNNERPEQFFYFVTGGAGTGKSHLIKCIHNEATKILRRLPTQDEVEGISRPTVLLTSFTGTASFNISGITLHSILKLPKNLKPPYQGLGNSLDDLRIFLSRVQILVIDEISMVSKDLFAYVDMRLQQIKGSKKPFGGISLLAVGDFFQLPPVGKAKELCVYEDNTHDLWRDRFQIITLTEIMRQKEDQAFAEMLNRLRVKKKSEPLLDCDRALLATRIFSSKDDCPLDVLHIFVTNKQVDEHNNDALFAFSPTVTYVDAQDHRKDDRTGRMVRQKAPSKGRQRDLPDTLPLAVGARVVITRNLDITDGLVNGTFGKVSQINTKTDIDGKVHVESIGLALDNPNAGLKRQSADKVVLIERLEERTEVKGLVRCQFPLKLAYACTAHKVQGMTSQSAVVSLKRVFEPGMAYVALSRTTSLQGLHVIDFAENKIYCNEDVLSSLENMPKADIGAIMPLIHAQSLEDVSLIVVHHNVEGLYCHIDDIKKHHEIGLADVLCFTETHLFGTTAPHEVQLEGYKMFLRNRQVSYSNLAQLAQQKGGGVAIYVKEHFDVQVIQYIFGVTDLEFLAVRVKNPVQAVVAGIYRPPNYDTKHFLSNLGPLLAGLNMMDEELIVICGDFNEDLKSNRTTPIRDLFTNLGYTQLIDKSTTEKNTMLDLIYTSQPQRCLSSGTMHSYFSYHNPVYVTVKK